MGTFAWTKIDNGNKAKDFWKSVGFLQSVLKHPFGVGEPIFYTFFAPLD
jgi:hypothetical protein